MSIEDTILHFVADLDFIYLPEIGDPTKIAIDWSTALVVPHD
jgi:hypothetical protein